MNHLLLSGEGPEVKDPVWWLQDSLIRPTLFFIKTETLYQAFLSWKRK
jgi:hypothetical protein